ncbi:OmpH family outer membrane protein [Planctomycetota bacterium]
MAKKVSLALAVLVAMMSFYALHRVTAQDAGPLKIGVITLKRFPDEYVPFIDKVAVLKQNVEEVKTRLREMERKMKGLTDRRELFEEGSEKWTELTAAIDEIRIEAATRLQSTKRQLEAKEKYFLKKLYADIRVGVDNYARDNGYDFVFIQTGAEISGKTAEEMTQMMYMKMLIHAKEEHDITDGVIKLMNSTVSTDGMQ